MVKLLKIVLNRGLRFPGSVVSGSLVVEVDKPKKYKLIKVKLVGRAEVHWSETNPSYPNPTTTDFTNKEEYITVSSILWRKEDAANGELQPGVHAWSFQFTLPLNIPPSFEGECGRIRYTLYGKIRNRCFKSNHKTAATIAVKQLPISRSTYPALLAPQQFEKEMGAKFVCGASQPIKLSFQLSKMIFSMGETIPLYLNVNNESSRDVKLVASIVRIENYRARRGSGHLGRRVVTTARLKKVAQVSSDQIEKAQSTGWDTELFVPKGIPPTFKNCSCISVEYCLKLKLKVPWASDDSVSVPIVIHNGQASHRQEPRIQPTLTVPSASTQQYSSVVVDLPTRRHSYQHAQQYGIVNVPTAAIKADPSRVAVAL